MKIKKNICLWYAHHCEVAIKQANLEIYHGDKT
jgi:hypothetical protein